MLLQKKKPCLHSEAAAVLCDTPHWKGCLAFREHVLRGDGQDLASSCSYRSVLALLLLPCFPLITTDKGDAGLWMERVVLTCLGEWAQVERGETGGGGLNSGFRNISTTVLLNMLPLCFERLQDFHRLMKDVRLHKKTKQKKTWAWHDRAERFVFI